MANSAQGRGEISRLCLRVARGVLPFAVALMLGVVPTQSAQAQTFTVLHSFTGGADGADTQAGLVFDNSGNLYGTTYSGGQSSGCWYPGTGCGVVFELTPGSGSWTESVLYTFTGGADGGAPYDRLIFDAVGNLYGTTSVGGAGGCTFGCGTAFQLTPTSTGWDENVIYDFTPNIEYPSSALTLDKSGNLFGVTSVYGEYGVGEVFELTNNGGSWNEKTIFSFDSPKNGGEPPAAPIFDSAGDLYGTTSIGGGGGCYLGGTVYELVHRKDGRWEERTLYAFKSGGDACNPRAGLVFDKAGNLYGTTRFGGKYGKGAVFQLRKQGKWKEKVVHSFRGGTDGAYPFSTLVFDDSGILYGTTVNGGAHDSGTVFKLSPGSSGRWKETLLYTFTGGADGSGPYDRLVMDAAGDIFGTTVTGGQGTCLNGAGCGVVFEITP